MTYDNQQLGYGNSDHPMHDEEQEITLEHVMGRLTIDEANFLENHITNLVNEAKKTNDGFKYRFQEAEKLQREINELESKKNNFQVEQIGRSKEENNAIWADLYVKSEKAKSELNQLLTRP